MFDDPSSWTPWLRNAALVVGIAIGGFVVLVVVWIVLKKRSISWRSVILAGCGTFLLSMSQWTTLTIKFWDVEFLVTELNKKLDSANTRLDNLETASSRAFLATALTASTVSDMAATVGYNPTTKQQENGYRFLKTLENEDYWNKAYTNIPSPKNPYPQRDVWIFDQPFFVPTVVEGPSQSPLQQQ